MPKRNLVLIVADTLRDPRPLRNGGPSLMPFLDEFSRSGISFEHLLASSSWTAPAHVALLTGTDPWETHFQLPGVSKRPPKAESVADRWNQAGGVSAGFSANYMVAPELGTATGYTRFNPGFPSPHAGRAHRALQAVGYEKALYWAVEAGRPGAGRPLARAASAGITWFGTGTSRMIGTLRDGPTLVRSVDRFLGIRWSRGITDPLHLFVNLVECHEPYLLGDNGGPANAPYTLANLPTINLARLTDALKPVGDPRGFLAAYRQSIPKVDAVLRGLVETLRRRGILDNAVLMFLSDHGQSLGESGFYGHGYRLYDELVKVPAYLWEFREGRPVGLPAPPADWIDHRHLFDLLSSAAADGGPVDPGEVLPNSLLRRGPAASYFEGPAPRPPAAIVDKLPITRKVYRLVRLQSAEGAAVVSSNTDAGELQDVPGESADPFVPELGEIGRQILASVKVVPASNAPGQAGMDSVVDARLKSWGYD